MNVKKIKKLIFTALIVRSQEIIINRCNEISWHIVPADKNWQKTYYVADVILKTLKELDIKWTELLSEKFNSRNDV